MLSRRRDEAAPTVFFITPIWAALSVLKRVAATGSASSASPSIAAVRCKREPVNKAGRPSPRAAESEVFESKAMFEAYTEYRKRSADLAGMLVH